MLEHPDIQPEIAHELGVRPKSSGIVIAMHDSVENGIAFDLSRLDEGVGFRVIFSSADVSFAVHPDDDADKVIRRRAIVDKAGVLFPDNVVEATTFKPNESRLAVTVSYDLTTDDSGIYQPGMPTIRRTVLNPDNYLTPTEANSIVVNSKQPASLLLKNSLSLAQQLIIRRIEMGSIPYLTNSDLSQISRDEVLANRGVQHPIYWKLGLGKWKDLLMK